MQKIQAVEIRCLRRLLGISYKDHVTNNEVRRRVTQQGQHYEDLLNTVKKRKLTWYWHVTLKKTILHGIVQGKRVRGRQKKSWADSILEWTGKSFAVIQAVAHNRWSIVYPSCSAPTTLGGYGTSNSNCHAIKSKQG